MTTGTAVSIASTTAGAMISYSTDGGTTWSTPAASPVSYTVNAAVTIQAKASATGYTDSAVSSAAYTITVPCGKSGCYLGCRYQPGDQLRHGRRYGQYGHQRRVQ